MDLSREFFGKLRGLALTLEKEARQLERALRREDVDYEDEPPIRVLQDLHCEIRTLKEDVNASLGKSYSEKEAINDFMKAIEILMQRNAADLGKIRELFQKYGYKPHFKDSTEEDKEVNSSDSEVSAQNKSEEEKPDHVPHPPASTEKPLVPKDPLRNPQLSDFGLSQYAFSRPWSAVKGQQATKEHQKNISNRTPLKPQTPHTLPKTPKCMLKMDDYECATPKLEHFGISEHTMCMNEDYTMSLLSKSAQTNKKLVKDDCEVNVQEVTSRESTVTPGPKPKMTPANAADWMASPMVLVFCTPEVKICSRANSQVLSRSPEPNELPLPSNKQNIEGNIPLALSSDEYLKHFGDPSPPKINHYDQLLSTPPPPEITRIPDDVLQILSRYNRVDTSKAKEIEAKAGNTTRYESDFSSYCNKENRVYPGFFKPNI
ncbi:Spindle and kinetochore-associated protein 3 [Calypte anna]|uniref:Spindle and kinetochore-associated protein 3 n=1 Tax=Calypte anna TaxID=9244 RepID=A0A091IJB5_CALAN|nr:Spindle and kinetochore-associated protein 3 [Calypte anna]